jgi:hypothetical protein
MLYRSYTETKQISGAITASSTSQTLSLRIPQNRRRLEQIILEVGWTNPGTAPTWSADGAYGLVTEVRLKVNDTIGQRNAVQASGSQLINWYYDQTGKINRYNLLGFQNATISTANKLVIPICVRHPAIDEPIGNILGLPMSLLNEDPTLEVDISNGSAASANPPTAITYVRAVLIFRDVDPSVKYLPTELVNSNWVLPGTGSQGFDIANSGFLTSLMLDAYSTAYTVRGTLFSATDYTHEWQVASGPIAVRRYFPDTLQCINDHVAGVPTTGVLDNAAYVVQDKGFYGFLGATTGAMVGPGLAHWALDFLFDDTLGGAISPASILNANTINLGGDKVRLTGTNFNATGTVKLLGHKFLTRTVDDLRALIGA